MRHSPPQGYPLPGWRGERQQGRLWNPVPASQNPPAQTLNIPHLCTFSVFPSSSAGCRLSRLSQLELAGTHIIYFQSLKNTPMCHHRQWAAGAGGLQPGNIPGWQFLIIIALSQDSICALFLCPVLGLLPLACSLSPYPRTRLHAHTLIPMCISTPSHNSHTHLYMLMHTCAYTYCLHTCVYTCAHDLTTAASTVLWPCERHVVGPSIKEVHIYLGAGGRERGLHCL